MKTDYIDIDNAPAIENLCFRRFRGAADFPHILKVMDDCIEADRLERLPTIEDLTISYAHLENCNPKQDMLFAEMHGRVIGYVRGYWWKDVALGLRYAHVGLVVPQWRDKGIGSLMLQ